MKNKRLATVLRFLSCYCIAMGCVTIFSLFEIVFEDKTEGILWGTAITINHYFGCNVAGMEFPSLISRQGCKYGMIKSLKSQIYFTFFAICGTMAR